MSTSEDDDRKPAKASQRKSTKKTDSSQRNTSKASKKRKRSAIESDEETVDYSAEKESKGNKEKGKSLSKKRKKSKDSVEEEKEEKEQKEDEEEKEEKEEEEEEEEEEEKEKEEKDSSKTKNRSRTSDVFLSSLNLKQKDSSSNPISQKKDKKNISEVEISDDEVPTIKVRTSLSKTSKPKQRSSTDIRRESSNVKSTPRSKSLLAVKSTSNASSGTKSKKMDLVAVTPQKTKKVSVPTSSSSIVSPEIPTQSPPDSPTTKKSNPSTSSSEYFPAPTPVKTSAAPKGVKATKKQHVVTIPETPVKSTPKTPPSTTKNRKSLVLSPEPVPQENKSPEKQSSSPGKASEEELSPIAFSPSQDLPQAPLRSRDEFEVAPTQIYHSPRPTKKRALFEIVDEPESKEDKDEDDEKKSEAEETDENTEDIDSVALVPPTQIYVSPKRKHSKSRRDNYIDSDDDDEDNSTQERVYHTPEKKSEVPPTQIYLSPEPVRKKKRTSLGDKESASENSPKIRDKDVGVVVPPTQVYESQDTEPGSEVDTPKTKKTKPQDDFVEPTQLYVSPTTTPVAQKTKNVTDDILVTPTQPYLASPGINQQTPGRHLLEKELDPFLSPTQPYFSPISKATARDNHNNFDDVMISPTQPYASPFKTPNKPTSADDSMTSPTQPYLSPPPKYSESSPNKEDANSSNNRDNNNTPYTNINSDMPTMDEEDDRYRIGGDGILSLGSPKVFGNSLSIQFDASLPPDSDIEDNEDDDSSKSNNNQNKDNNNNQSNHNNDNINHSNNNNNNVNNSINSASNDSSATDPMNISPQLDTIVPPTTQKKKVPLRTPFAATSKTLRRIESPKMRKVHSRVQKDSKLPSNYSLSQTPTRLRVPSSNPYKLRTIEAPNLDQSCEEMYEEGEDNEEYEEYEGEEEGVECEYEDEGEYEEDGDGEDGVGRGNEREDKGDEGGNGSDGETGEEKEKEKVYEDIGPVGVPKERRHLANTTVVNGSIGGGQENINVQQLMALVMEEQKVHFDYMMKKEIVKIKKQTEEALMELQTQLNSELQKQQIAHAKEKAELIQKLESSEKLVQILRTQLIKISEQFCPILETFQETQTLLK